MVHKEYGFGVDYGGPQFTEVGGTLDQKTLWTAFKWIFYKDLGQFTTFFDINYLQLLWTVVNPLWIAYILIVYSNKLKFSCSIDDDDYENDDENVTMGAEITICQSPSSLTELKEKIKNIKGAELLDLIAFNGYMVKYLIE